MAPHIISEACPVPVASPGKADIVGFGSDGVYLARNSWGKPQCIKVLDGFSRDDGWNNKRHVRLLADLTGNKRSDIVGFGEKGVWTAHNMGDGTFSAPRLALNDFGYSIESGGWRVDMHPRLLADLRNTGCADIVGFGQSGTFVSRNNNSGKFGAAELAVPDFGWDQGWRIDQHPRFLADTTGDGLLDIVGFGFGDVLIAQGRGDGTFKAPRGTGLEEFCVSSGWKVDKHPRYLADLTGDGTADIIGFKDEAIIVALNDGKGNFKKPMISPGITTFTCVEGWKVDQHPCFVLPLTTQKTADIIGFGHLHAFVARGNGDGTYRAAVTAGETCSYIHGWRVGVHPRFLADLTGNGCVDIVGFGNSAVWAAFNNGDGTFGPTVKLMDGFSPNSGWSCDNSVRYMANM